MEVGMAIKNTRERKGLSQKQVAAACKMDPGQYSRIENGKTDPAFSSVVKIAKAMKVSLAELFQSEQKMPDTPTADKTTLEKVSIIEKLDKKEKNAIYTLIDALAAKKKMTQALGEALNQAK